MNTPTRTTARLTIFVSALVLILLTAACSEEPTAGEQVALEVTTTPTTSTAPVWVEPPDTAIPEDLTDPLAGCQGRSGLTEKQSEENADAIFDRLADVLPVLHQRDTERGTDATQRQGIVWSLAFSYSLCGVSHGEVAALLEEGELGRQYATWVESLGRGSYSDFVDAYAQQPCWVASEFGQQFIPNYDMDGHAEAVNLTGLIVFNPTDREVVEIGESLILEIFGEEGTLTSDTLASLDDFGEPIICEDLMSSLDPVSDMAGAEAEAMKETLALIAQCESGSDYQAVNLSHTERHFDGRLGSRGAYQFGQGTWDWIADETTGLRWLVGVSPERAPQWAQDAMARHLYKREVGDNMAGEGNYSWRHWGECPATQGGA